MPCKRSSAVPIPFGFRLSVAPVAPLRSASSDTISSMRFRAASSILAQYCLTHTQLCAGPENSEASVRLRSYGCLFFCVAFNLAGCAGGRSLAVAPRRSIGAFRASTAAAEGQGCRRRNPPPAGAYGSTPLRFSGGGWDGAPTRAQRMHALTNFIGTSMRSATCSGVIPLFRNRLQTAFIFSPTSTICLSGS